MSKKAEILGLVAIVAGVSYLGTKLREKVELIKNPELATATITPTSINAPSIEGLQNSAPPSNLRMGPGGKII